MRWGPTRGMMAGGIATGVVVLVIGVLLFLVNQRIISINVDFWTVCAIGLIGLGIMILIGTVYAQRWMRGGWQKWIPGEDRPGP